MSEPRRRNGKPSLAERWPLYRDIGAFLIGAFMLIWQTVFEENAQDILAIVGFAALGIAGSGVAQRFLADKLGHGNGSK
jgi:drug/metabolite transporter (DMT)-like permease